MIRGRGCRFQCSKIRAGNLAAILRSPCSWSIFTASIMIWSDPIVELEREDVTLDSRYGIGHVDVHFHSEKLK